MQQPRRYGAVSSSQAPSVQGVAPATHERPHTQDEPWRKKILFAGIRQAGKTSIQEVVFNSVPPKDTFYLETTTSIRKMDIDSIVSLQFWDCPANILTNFDSLGVPLTHFQSIVFVIDVQDDYQNPIAHLIHLIATVAQVNPTVSMNILIHKAEALSDEYKIETFQYIQGRVLDDLLDHPDSALMAQVTLNFHMTSVFDHTIYEAVSRIVQRLSPQLATLENLMNTLVSNSGIAKAFLFDITALIYVATDASPVDNASFELCCDYVQMLTSFSNLYKNLKPLPPPEPPSPVTSASRSHNSPTLSNGSGPKTDASIPSLPATTSDSESSETPSGAPAEHTAKASRSKAPRRPPDGPEDVSTASPSHSLISTGKAQGSPTSSNGSGSQHTAKGRSSTLDSNGSGSRATRSKTLDRLLPSDDEPKRWSTSSAKLTPESTLAYWQITDALALVCLIRSETFEKHRGLIEYNVTFFRGAVQKIVELERSKRFQ